MKTLFCPKRPIVQGGKYEIYIVNEFLGIYTMHSDQFDGYLSSIDVKLEKN